MLPPEAYKMADNRLHISITEPHPSFQFLKNTIVHRFHSNDELLNYMLASCYVPFYYETPVYVKNKLCFDGGFSNNNPTIDTQTIKISPYSFSDAHIKPYMSPFSPLDAFLFIPAVNKMLQLEKQGYEDSISFLNHWTSSLQKGSSTQPSIER